MKLIILLLFEDIKANLFYPSAGFLNRCPRLPLGPRSGLPGGFLNRCPRLPLGPRSGLPGSTSRGRDIANPTDEQGATSFDSLYKEATNYERLKTTALVLVDSSRAFRGLGLGNTVLDIS